MTILIGDPIQFDNLLNSEGAKSLPRGKLYDAVATRIGHQLHELKVQVDKLTLQQEHELQNRPFRNTERSAEILQQVDWESFGIGSFTSNEDDKWPEKETQIQRKLESSYQKEPSPSDWYFRVGFSYERGIASRMRGFMDPTEFMSFAARGLFMNRKAQKVSSPREAGPLKAWKQFLEANALRQRN